MRISDLIKMGLKNLARRKARTTLTIVGVVIGTISIVVMVSIGIGMNHSFEKSLMEQGSLTTVTVNQYSWFEDENGVGQSVRNELNDDVVERIKAIDHVKAVSPIVSPYIELTSGKYRAWCEFNVMDLSTWEEFEGPKITEGMVPTEDNKKVILFSRSLLSSFGRDRGWNWESHTVDLSKERIQIQLGDWMNYVEQNNGMYSEGMVYTEPKAPKESKMVLKNYGIYESSQNWSYENSVYMDIEYYKDWIKKFARTLNKDKRKELLKTITEYREIRINVDNVRNVSKVEDALKEMGYQGYSSSDALEQMKQTSNMLQLVLGCIGGVSMLVSAISIANTMIMSIYERTKEIGVMKVLGCYVRDVKKLFLFESAMIGLLGGSVGIGLSYLGSWAINKYGAPVFQKLMQGNYMMELGDSDFSIIPIWLPAVAILFAMLIGIISGYYPARRATRISAIEAMKTES